ncbi:MAG: hypothetical protein KDA25_10330 [Phycisphaerales bacterium]|nr:hypothetical protein [Phycisphaerales bacterium]
MSDALDAVKRDLGADAVILQTRTMREGGFLGLGRRTVVEVTAAPPDVVSRDRRPATNTTPAAGRENGRNGTARRAVAAYGAEPAATSPGPSELDRRRTQRLAQLLAERHERLAGEPPLPTPAAPAAPAPATTVPPPARSAPPIPAPADPTTRADGDAAPARRAPAAVAQRFMLRPPDAADGMATNDHPQRAAAPAPTADVRDRTAEAGDRSPDQAGDRSGARVPHVVLNGSTERPSGRRGTLTLFEESGSSSSAAGASLASASPGEAGQSMQDELAAIRDMVGQVLQRQTAGKGGPRPSMPKALFDMYLKLIAQDLSEELADRIVNEIRDELGSTQLGDVEAVRASACRHLSDYVPIADEPVSRQSPDGRPLTIALIGPTGVGKTTTLAKLAASFKLRHHRKVGLVTSDTYRIAAVDQLRTYANIIGLPLKVALTPAEMRQAVHALSDCDVVLIDTAGRSQNDTSRLDELADFIDAADPHEVHLVLSSTASEKVLLKEAEAFSVIDYDKVVLTKLDEAVSFGMILNVMQTIGKRLSFVTTGQEVPDHIELGRADRIAELILGGQVQA